MFYSFFFLQWQQTPKIRSTTNKATTPIATPIAIYCLVLKSRPFEVGFDIANSSIKTSVMFVSLWNVAFFYWTYADSLVTFYTIVAVLFS